MDGLSDDDVARLLPLLAARSRASQGTSESFRPPRTGIVEQAAADWHQFVVGRRGVGKSMLLLNVANHARKLGSPVAYIDIETLRGNPYPDVLIQLLVDLIGALDESLNMAQPSWIKRRGTRRGLRRLQKRLMILLSDPQTFEHRYQSTERTTRVARLRGRLRAGKDAGPADARLDGELERGRERGEGRDREATFTRTKMEGLQTEAVEFRRVLRSAMSALRGASSLFIIDDFYFIPRENQPDVLSYLHQVVKNLNIWLKVGAVEHRLLEFVEGDPPRGLQLTQDAGKIQMDATLQDFDHTRDFLERILGDICDEARVPMTDVVTEVARERLVLASGGVPRDYLNLLQEALAKSTKRSVESMKPPNKITAEDVNEVAPAFLKQKEDELKLDASQADVGRLREQFSDLLAFCIHARKVNVFLVEARLLQEEQWGKDVSALADLRFIHRIGNVTVKSSSPEYTGRRYEAFALDLSSYAGTRVTTITQVEFWTPDGRQKLRGARHIYSPEIAAEAAANVVAEPRLRRIVHPGALQGQLTIDDVDPPDA